MSAESVIMVTGAAVVGGAGAFVGKVLWDWMPKPPKPPECKEVQAACATARKEDNKKFEEFQLQSVRTMERLESGIAHIREEMASGTAIFKEIRDELKRHGEEIAASRGRRVGDSE